MSLCYVNDSRLGAWGLLRWSADDAILYIRRLHTFGCDVNRRRGLVRFYVSSHGNNSRQRGRKQGHIKCEITHMRTINYTQYTWRKV